MKAWLRVGICLGLATLLIHLIVTGELTLFVNPRFTWLMIVSVLILLVLGLVQLWNLKAHEMHQIGAWGYLLLFVPIALYLLVPPQALDASIAAKKGVYLSAKSVNQEQQTNAAAQSAKPDAEPAEALSVPEDPYQKFVPLLKRQSIIELSQEHYADYFNAIHNDPHAFKGKQISVKGFIYRDKTLGKDQFVVGRFSVTCCTADAIVIGFIAEGKQAASFKANDWVEVTGALGITKYDDVDMPMIQLASVKRIKPLTDPYVYLDY